MSRLIDADVLYELIEEDFDGVCVYDVYPSEAVRDFQSIVDRTPTVDAEPVRHGRWILKPSNTEQGERDFIWWECSECGQVIYSESNRDRREFHAYCGRCGAKMDEVTE